MSNEIPAEEIADVLRAALGGEFKVKRPKGQEKWAKVYAGNVDFLFGDWKVCIFNDCDSLDYIDNVEAPDGRECHNWRNGVGEGDGINFFCPTWILSQAEQDDLEKLLQEA